MKKIIKSATFLLILTAGSFVARGQDTGTASASLFGKGTWLINLYRPIDFTAYIDNYAHSSNRFSDFSLNLEDYYFFHNNMGVGLNLDLTRSVSNSSYKLIGTTAMVFASYLQGFDIGGIDFLAKIGVGIGKSKVVNKSFASNDIISSQVQFKFEAGPVFKLFDNQSLLFEPTLGFSYGMTSYLDYKEKKPDFLARANFIFNLGYNDFNCDSKTGFADSHLRFARGMNTIGAYTMFEATFGDLTQSYNGYFNKYVTNSQSFMLNYRHFIADGLSIGGFAGISNDYQKSTAESESSYNSRITDFIIGPGATWYPITGRKYLENIFADLNIGIGENINKDYATRVKAGVFGGYFDAGYDYGISKNLSIDPALGFKVFRFNYPGSTEDYTESGPFFSIGLKATF
jgi:hypothetical protein